MTAGQWRDMATCWTSRYVHLLSKVTLKDKHIELLDNIAYGNGNFKMVNRQNRAIRQNIETFVVKERWKII